MGDPGSQKGLSSYASHPRTPTARSVQQTRVKADSFQGFQNGASSESCPLASATGPMHDAQCGLVLVIAYFFNYIDHTSVGFAALQMNKDIGLTATRFGWGAGIMFFSYCLLEVPSNLAMYRFSARKWIARIMITWGLAAAATALLLAPSASMSFVFF